MLLAAYGYGFLMVTLVSLASFLGVCILPFVFQKSERGRLYYEYIHAFMVALAASALLCDGILHLTPHVSSHEHSEVSCEVSYRCSCFMSMMKKGHMTVILMMKKKTMISCGKLV